MKIAAASAQDLQLLLSKVATSLEEVEAGRMVIECVLTEIASSTTVGGE